MKFKFLQDEKRKGIERRDAETQREIWTLRLCVQDLILLEISDEFIHSFDICIF